MIQNTGYHIEWINKKEISLEQQKQLKKDYPRFCLSVANFRFWNVEENKHEIGLSHDQGMALETIINLYLCEELEHNNDSQIVQEISEIRFPYLTSINLNGNQIHSIQSLTRIHMPQLNSLSFVKNKICQIRVLRKENWQKLSHLQIRKKQFYKDNNRIAQMSSLNFLFSTLKKFVVEADGNSYLQCNDLRPILKSHMNIADDGYLHIQSKKRIKQKIKEMLEKKAKSKSLQRSISSQSSRSQRNQIKRIPFRRLIH